MTTHTKIDAIRTIFWFEGVRLALGVKTAYAVQRAVEPEHVGGGSKWARYQQGKSTPRRSLVAKTALLVRSSQYEINNTLWKVLDTPVMTQEIARDLLRLMPPELQCMILNSNQVILQKITDRLLGQFLRKTSLDSLAVLTLIIKLRLSEENYEDVWKLGFSIHRMLLILGMQFKIRGIGQAIYEIYIKQIFSKIKFNGESFYSQHFQYSSLSVIFPALIDAIKYSSLTYRTIKTLPKRTVWGGIFKGRWGKERALAFNPITGPDLDLGPPNKDSIKILRDKWKEYYWCFENLLPLNSQPASFEADSYFIDEVNSLAIFGEPVAIKERWVDVADLFPNDNVKRSGGRALHT